MYGFVRKPLQYRSLSSGAGPVRVNALQILMTCKMKVTVYPERNGAENSGSMDQEANGGIVGEACNMPCE